MIDHVHCGLFWNASPPPPLPLLIILDALYGLPLKFSNSCQFLEFESGEQHSLLGIFILNNWLTISQKSTFSFFFLYRHKQLISNCRLHSRLLYLEEMSIWNCLPFRNGIILLIKAILIVSRVILTKKNASYHTWWHVRTTWKLISLKSRFKFKKKPTHRTTCY